MNAAHCFAILRSCAKIAEYLEQKLKWSRLLFLLFIVFPEEKHGISLTHIFTKFHFTAGASNVSSSWKV